MGVVPLEVTREGVLAFRGRAGGLAERLPGTDHALRAAAWAGLTDSVPRAAVLSLHARVDGTTSQSWQDPPLVQVWGPRFSAYVIDEQDRAVFTLGRLPEASARRRFAEGLAARLDTMLGGREMPYGEAGRALGEHHNQLRYAATTGRVLIRWDGARQPTVRTVPPPAMDAAEARLELVRRYLHVLGPAAPDGFARWAGVRIPAARAAFDALAAELSPVRTPAGESWVLSRDEPDLRAGAAPTAPVRLLPSGDAYYLLWGRDRELLVPDADHRAALWTSRVWPGAVLVRGEVVGTWRRAEERMTVTSWWPLTADAREAVEAEAASLPLPGLRGSITVRWAD